MILATRGGDLEVRAFPATMSDPPSRLSSLGGAGVPVTASTASGVPAFAAAVRIAATQVACLRMRVWRGEGPLRKRVDTVWQARLFRGRPNPMQTRFGFWETVEESLSKRGNAYVWKTIDPATGRVVQLWALHPDQVGAFVDRAAPGGVSYQVAVAPGYIDPTGNGGGFYTVTTSRLLHIRGHGDGGAMIAPSPIEQYRLALGLEIAKLTHEARTYRKGGAIRQVIEYPDAMDVEAVMQWRDLWRETYESADGETTAVLGGGGTLKPISMSMGDAQFIESRNLGVAECARIVGTPASLLEAGGNATAGARPLSPEHELTRWLRYGLGWRLERIESAFAGDPAMFEPFTVEPGFDTAGYLRGDLATEEMMLHQAVQDGRLLVDEARAMKGLDPLPNGAGSVPVVNPAGAGATPDQFLPAPDDPAIDDPSDT